MATFKSVSRYAAGMCDFTVHVHPAYPVEALDEGDLDDAGNCIVDGSYRLSLKLTEEVAANIQALALEAFHALSGVYEPVFFTFMVSTRNDAMDGALRRDLGAWEVVDTDTPGMTRIIQKPDAIALAERMAV